jgi:hypothetical protein
MLPLNIERSDQDSATLFHQNNITTHRNNQWTHSLSPICKHRRFIILVLRILTVSVLVSSAFMGFMALFLSFDICPNRINCYIIDRDNCDDQDCDLTFLWYHPNYSNETMCSTMDHIYAKDRGIGNQIDCCPTQYQLNQCNEAITLNYTSNNNTNDTKSNLKDIPNTLTLAHETCKLALEFNSKPFTIFLVVSTIILICLGTIIGSLNVFQNRVKDSSGSIQAGLTFGQPEVSAVHVWVAIFYFTCISTIVYIALISIHQNCLSSMLLPLLCLALPFMLVWILKADRWVLINGNSSVIICQEVISLFRWRYLYKYFVLKIHVSEVEYIEIASNKLEASIFCNNVDVYYVALKSNQPKSKGSIHRILCDHNEVSQLKRIFPNYRFIEHKYYA